MDINPYDRDLAVRTMIGEAGNQGDKGLAGVGAVILNRLNDGSYGKTIGDVVLAPKQFEPWATRSGELLNYSDKDPKYQRAAKIFDQVAGGQMEDPTGGSTHFLNPDIVRQRSGALPGWASGEPTAVIGQHAFYTPGPRKSQQTEPDLLSNWNPAQKAPAAESTQAPVAQGKEDDLLSHWPAQNAPTDSARPPATMSITARKGDALPDNSPGKAIADLVANHQGDDLGDTALRSGAGLLRGGYDVSNTLARGIGYGAEKGANALESMGIISPESAKAVADFHGRINSNIANDNSQFDRAAADSPVAQVSRVGGQIIGTAPLLGAGGALLEGSTAGAPVVSALMSRPLVSTAIRGAGIGAGANALTSASSDESLGDQMTSGGGIGAVLGPLGYGASRLGRAVAGGPIGQATAALAERARNAFGIPITAGQMSENPLMRFADSVMQRLPFTGYGARTAEQRTAFNRGIANSFGENADSITHDVVNRARDRIGDVFDDVARRTGSIHVDQPFATDLQRIVTTAEGVLDDATMKPLRKQLENVVSVIDHNTGTINPDSYQTLTRKGGMLDGALKSKNADLRHYAGQIREALDDVMQRSAPADAVQDLLQARRQWKALKTVEPLVDKAVNGNISPADLLNKVNKSYSGGRAGGGGDLRELGNIGKRFLQEPPSSGTSERLLAMKLGAAALGAGGLAYFDPENLQRDAALAAGAFGGGRLLSAGLRSNALADFMIRRGLNAGRVPVGNALDYLPAVGALSSSRRSSIADAR